jgi:ABC-type transport system substrate-binding protein
MSSYWQKTLNGRITRRRSLAALGVGAAGAAFLAACGGSDGNGADGDSDPSGLVTRTTDETDKVKTGGVYKSYTPVELVQFDPHIFGSSVTLAEQVFSRLVRVADGHMKNTDGTIEGDILESWEMSPDNLTLTAKVTKKARFSNTPPVNGRAVDVRDVVFSWNRFKEVGARRGEFVNSVNPAAPIVSMDAPDAETLVVRLDKPNATILPTLALDTPGTLAIVAKEAQDDKALDLRTTPIGSGPWFLEGFVPGAGFFFKKNQGFQQDSRKVPYMDGIDWPSLREYAAALSQFRAGAIYHYTVQAADIVPTKRDLPQLVMRDSPLTSDSMRTFFGLVPDSPFKDERVRRAWTMTWDRDLFIDVLYNTDEFQAEGLMTQTAWDAALRADSWEGWWLDPQSDSFGRNAAYFRHDLAEAKKLLEAAGHANGLDTTLHYAAPGQSSYPPRYYDTFEVVVAMVEESRLFRFERDLVNYNTEWTPKFREARGNFNGVAMKWDTDEGDPAGYLFARFNPAGGLYIGSDDRLNDLTQQAVRQFDDDKRRELVHEIQRVEGGTMYYPALGGATGFALHWPIVRNREVWQGGSGRGLYTTLFLDETQAPGGRT